MTQTLNVSPHSVKTNPDHLKDHRSIDGWIIGMALVGLAFIGYVLGFLSLGRSLFAAVSIATSHILPATLAGVIAWRLQPLVRRRTAPASWLIHAVLALAYGLFWSSGLALIAWLFSPEILPLLIREVLSWTAISGLLVYGFLAAANSAIAFRRRALERDAAAAKAELAALRARVEPHFLYNALESISGLVRTNPDAAEEAIARLGSALRRLLERDENPTHTNPDRMVALADELSVVRDTLFIEKLRMGGRLKIIERIADETLDLAVPSLTLQPLVENAIQHGLAKRVEGGTLSIVTRQDGDRLVLEVSDDGVGADEKTLSDAPSLGLDHLRKRLTGHFGDSVRFNIAATPGHGVSVQISIPAIEV